jgi:murein DD-endopeptidase MepM/ murein hydrolase activator NlpD
MARRLACALLVATGCSLAVAGLAGGAGPTARKQRIDERISRLHDRIAQARERENALKSKISSTTEDIRALEQQVGDVSRRLAPLENDLALHRHQLDRLNHLFRLQTRRLRFLRRNYRLAVHRLNVRLVAIYESEPLDTISAVLTSTNLGDLLDRVELTRHILLEDQHIVSSVARARSEVRRAHAHTRHTRKRVAAVTRVIAYRTAQVRSLRDSLLARENALTSGRAENQQAASSLHEDLKEMLDEAGALQQVSETLAATIQASQSSGSGSSGHASSSGLIWPVNGPVVSPFGYRCLNGLCRMHEGIDIGVGSGTPIHAAAAGTVIYAGWLGGYGNVTVVDHGGGLSTAYAHQASFAVTGGHVSQGQVIGYSDCTGHCFGPHLHFEVRVNGKPVDPMGYL